MKITLWLTCFTFASLIGMVSKASVAEEVQSFTAYGFLLPSWMVSSSAAESFSQPNLSAYTAAGNPVLATAREQVRSSFQVAQSRIGFLFKATPLTSGRLEFDFIDFSKSSPTTASLPRVRRGVIEYSLTSDLLFRFGQDWDLISPLAPHGYNYVGHYFESGDIGFMRIQAQAILRKENWEHGFALGLPTANPGAADNNIELTVLPTAALREAYHFSSTSQVGVSLLAAGLRQSVRNSDRLFAGALTAFFETRLSDSLELKSEAYVGQNTHNLGLLGLAYGNTTFNKVRESGAYVSLRAQLGHDFGSFVGVGGAWIWDPSQMPSSYALVAGNNQLAGSGPGLENNWTVRLGGDWKANEKLIFFVEAALLSSKHHLLAADTTIYNSHRTTTVTQVGSQFSF